MEENKVPDEPDQKKVAKVQRKGRQTGLSKSSKDKAKDTKNEEEQEAVVVKEEAPKTAKDKALKWMEQRTYVIIMITTTVLALFLSDAVNFFSVPF